MRDIAEMQLPPGSVLLPEQAMAEEYGVGRASVREALRMLEMGGLISIRQGVGGGPVVVAPKGSEFAGMMTLYLQLAGAKVEQLLEAVPLLEAMMAYAAAQHVATKQASDEDVATVNRLAHAPLRGDDNETFVEIAGSFHRAIGSMLGNPVLELLIRGVGELFSQRAIRQRPNMYDAEHGAEVAAHHIAIADAITAGDAPLAMQRMLEHQQAESDAVLAADPAVADDPLDWR